MVASGIRISARVWTSLTVLKLLPLLALLVAVFVFVGPRRRPPVALRRAPPGSGRDLHALFTFQGFEIVPVIAGQVERSPRAMPFATVGSLLAGLPALRRPEWPPASRPCPISPPRSARSPRPPASRRRGVRATGRPRDARRSPPSASVSGMMVTTPHYLSALACGGERVFDLDRLDREGRAHARARRDLGPRDPAGQGRRSGGALRALEHGRARAVRGDRGRARGPGLPAVSRACARSTRGRRCRRSWSASPSSSSGPRGGKVSWPWARSSQASCWPASRRCDPRGPTEPRSSRARRPSAGRCGRRRSPGSPPPLRRGR